MTPAGDRATGELIGRRVVFKGDEEHAACWHCRAGLVGGVVLRPAQTLAQKAEWIRGEGGEVPDDWMNDYEDVPKVWVKADPVEGLPRGCEVAVEVECLLIEGEPGALAPGGRLRGLMPPARLEAPMVQYSFPGKVVLVTGSSRGMGACILEGFARAGAVCLLNYFDDPTGQNLEDAEETAARLRQHGAAVHPLEGDVSKYESVQAMMKKATELAGGLDVLVNNAGVLRDRTVKKMTPEEWHTVLETNLDGVFYCSKLGAEVMRDGGRIVNISSISGVAGFHGQANYAAAKAGVIALTKVLSKELARRGITVNAVAPGVIQTPMLGGLKPEVLAEYEKQIPVGRIGRPEDVAHAVQFLACEESSYITGQTLPITGGWF